jgi:hypothetical protein
MAFNDDITVTLSDLNSTINSNSWPSLTIFDANTSITTGSIGATWLDSNINSSSGQLSLTGENADIVVNGESLMSMIQNIQERLNILRPNEHLEAEWDQLRELGDAYRKLEAELLEKQRMWNALKK